MAFPLEEVKERTGDSGGGAGGRGDVAQDRVRLVSRAVAFIPVLVQNPS